MTKYFSPGVNFHPRIVNLGEHCLDHQLNPADPAITDQGPWSVQPTCVGANYLCPLCQISTGPRDPSQPQLDFGLWAAILSEPICECCFRLLPYLLTTVPGEMLHPPPTILVRLAELLKVPDERILIIRYINHQLAKMEGAASFRTHFTTHRDLQSRARVTRRIAKKRWKAILFELKRTRETVRQQLLPEIALAWLV